jgi:homoserine dehydrogenase
VQIDSIAVLKFGGSILGENGDIIRAVHEIYRFLRSGRRVVAVVSALGRTTDMLLEQANELFGNPEPSGLAALLATGEATSAALLALALDRAGIPATRLDPWRVGLRTSGPLLDAEPVEINRQEIYRALEERPVVILSGFVGYDRDGYTSLLGRGGSDLTALFVAQRLGAATCRLIKDVGGLYEWDPTAGDGARRYTRITWEDTLGLGGQVVQEKTVLYAQRFGIPFEVGGLCSAAGTLVGRGPTTFAEPGEDLPPLRVALLGLGTVGLGVYRHMAAWPQRFRIVGIAVRQLGKHLGDGVPLDLISTDPMEIVNRPSDLVIEAIGGDHPASDLVEAALLGGRDVITANKSVMAYNGPRLARIAEQRGRQLLYSATVGGGVPIVESITSLARLRPIHSVEGVLNATCNFVLDQMVAGCDLATAVRHAQEKGFAEADPSADLTGLDAAHKLVIVARAAFGVDLDLDHLEYRGIQNVDPAELLSAHAAGATVRLVASCRRTPDGGVEAHVRPVRLPAYHPLARPRNEENRVLIQPTSGPPTVVDGKGAGRWPTAESVFADVLDVWRLRRDQPLPETWLQSAGPVWEPGTPLASVV